MSQPTCSQCKFCEIFAGYTDGKCYGLPPAMFQNGAQSETITPAPRVKGKRRACALFQPIPEGETNIVGKNPDTVNQAYKAAHQVKPPAVAKPVIPAPTKPKTPVNDF